MDSYLFLIIFSHKYTNSWLVLVLSVITTITTGQYKHFNYDSFDNDLIHIIDIFHNSLSLSLSLSRSLSQHISTLTSMKHKEH